MVKERFVEIISSVELTDISSIKVIGSVLSELTQNYKESNANAVVFNQKLDI